MADSHLVFLPLLQRIKKSAPKIDRMPFINRLKIYYTFLRSFYISGCCISVCCGWLFYRWGSDVLAPVFYFKLFTAAIIFYAADRLKQKEYYYYHNLGLTKLKLWVFYEFCDLLLFVLLLIVANLLPRWEIFWK